MKRRVLFVDDSRLILRTAELFLNGRYEVLKAGSGGEALEKAVAEQPDLILMDFNLPDWNGYQIKEFLAEDERTRDIPVVIVSTACQLEQCGWNVDHLVKPFNEVELLGKVLEYVPLETQAAA